jgi:polyferredoxin
VYIRLAIYIAVSLFGLSYLVLWGKRGSRGLEGRSRWYPRAPYVFALVISVAASFWLGRLPNPMAGTTRLYKAIVGIYPSVLPYAAVFLLFILLAVVGNKLICGWACPLGALQELIYSIPGVDRLPKLRVKFAVSNAVRAALLILMIVIPVGTIGGRYAVIDKYLNAFNLFEFRAPVWSVLLIVAATIVLSPFIYRPFCRFICPFGIVSWFAERISIFRVRIDRKACTRCGECIRACPLSAAKGIVEGKAFPEDCFSCARCLNKCPQDAISYRSILKS